VSAVLARVQVGDAVAPLVLVDGRSGAGKSSLARRLLAAWPGETAAQLIALDDLYPGWDGLAEGSRYARENILLPHSRGTTGEWRRWDWARAERAEVHQVDPASALIVEGAGAITPESATLADVTVWVEAPRASRKQRGLDRDGDAYRPYWDRWAAQEDLHIAAHRPAERASLVVAIP